MYYVFSEHKLSRTMMDDEAIHRALEYFACCRIPKNKPVQMDSSEIDHQPWMS